MPCGRGQGALGCAGASLSGLGQVFSWPAFGLMLIGIGLGFAVGIPR